MGKWAKILGVKEEDRSTCPNCLKQAVRRLRYELPGSSMGVNIDSSLRRLDMNCVVEYRCDECGFTYR